MIKLGMSGPFTATVSLNWSRNGAIYARRHFDFTTRNGATEVINVIDAAVKQGYQVNAPIINFRDALEAQIESGYLQ